MKYYEVNIEEAPTYERGGGLFHEFNTVQCISKIMTKFYFESL